MFVTPSVFKLPTVALPVTSRVVPTDRDVPTIARVPTFNDVPVFSAVPTFNVEEIKTHDKLVLTDIGELKFDYLVVASGSETNYFGNSDIEKYSMARTSIT